MNNRVPWIAETCGRCNKPLKTTKSREQGYGPYCMRKVKEEQEKAQMNINEIVEVEK